MHSLVSSKIKFILNNEIYTKVKIGKLSGVPRPLKHVYFLFFSCILPSS